MLMVRYRKTVRMTRDRITMPMVIAIMSVIHAVRMTVCHENDCAEATNEHGTTRKPKKSNRTASYSSKNRTTWNTMIMTICGCLFSTGIVNICTVIKSVSSNINSLICTYCCSPRRRSEVVPPPEGVVSLYAPPDVVVSE